MAGHLGRTVGELSEAMDADEFAEWLAFDQLSPIGGERADCLAAMQSALTANLWSKRKVSPKQFLPRWGREHTGKTPEQLRAYFTQLKNEAKRVKRRG